MNKKSKPGALGLSNKSSCFKGVRLIVKFWIFVPDEEHFIIQQSSFRRHSLSNSHNVFCLKFGMMAWSRRSLISLLFILNCLSKAKKMLEKFSKLLCTTTILRLLYYVYYTGVYFIS